MKVQYQGKDAEANEVEVLISDEHWNTYQLADGKVLMFKEVLVSVIKIEGETDPQGNPVYQFQTSKVTRIK